MKFLWQLFGAAVAVGCGVQVGLIPLTGVGAAFSIVYLVGGANSLNLLDGMDGMAAGTAVIRQTIEGCP